VKYNLHNINTVCLFLPHGIGDVICATPIISGLKESKASLHITVIVKNASTAEIFGGKTAVDKVVVFDSYQKNKLRKLAAFIFHLRKQKFDLFISDHPGKTSLLAFLIGAKIRISEKSNFLPFLLTHSFKTDFSVHKVVNYWRLLELLNISVKNNPSVFFSTNDLQYVEQNILKRYLSSAYIVIHPGCGQWGIHKRWASEKFMALIKNIIVDFNGLVFLVGDKTEEELCDNILNNVQSNKVISLAGQLNIRQLSALLSSAKLVIGNDSGVMHLASACGAATISIFGPTLDKWTSPFLNNTVIAKDISCRPCYLQLPYGCANPICMDIEVEDVYRVVKMKLV
jgi:heptosyltransferase II